MNQEILDAIKEDCKVLLARALLDKTVNVFGIDGMGQYGTHHQGIQYRIDALSVDVDSDAGMMDIHAIVHIALDNYNSALYGDAATDKNLEISLNQLFKDADIPRDCWTWANREDQGMISFAIRLDVVKLLSW